MARQFREQLEEEVQLEEARKAKPMTPPPPAAEPAAGPAVEPAAAAAPPPPPPDPPLPPRPPTFSHAHPTDDTGADTTVRTAASADEQRT